MTDVARTEACQCARGWVFVDDDYVTKQAGKARRSDGSTPAGLVDGLRASVRPCHQCQPGLYDQWREGQLVGQGARRVGRKSRRRSNREERF
jgi:hypothetical protein